MTTTDIDIGEEAIRRLAGQLFDAPKDRIKAKEIVSGKGDGSDKGKPKSQKQGTQKIISRAQVYKLGDHFLAEAVLIGQHNQPYWIISDH